MPVQLWNLGSTVYSATDPSGPGSNFRRSPSVLSGPQPKQWPSHSTSMARTIAEVAKSTPLTYLPARWGGTSREVDTPTYLPTRWGGTSREVDAPTYLPTRWGGTSREVDAPTYLPARWGGTCRGVDGPTYLPTRWGGLRRGVDGH